MEPSSLDLFSVPVSDLPIPAVVVDRDGYVSDLNDQFSSRIGYSRADLVGKSANILVPVRVRGRHQALMESFFDNPSIRAMGTRESKVSIVTLGGEEVPCEIALYPCDENDCVLALVSLLSSKEHVGFYRQLVLSSSLIALGICMEIAREAVPGLTAMPDGNLVVGAGAAILAHLGFSKPHQGKL